MFRRTRSTSRKVAAVAVGVVGVVSVAHAAVPDANGVIRACYCKNGGALRVSDSGTC